MRKLLKKRGFAPDVLVTDRVRSYGAAKAEIGLSARHEPGLAQEQSGREFASTDSTPRAEDAAFQIARISPTIPVCSRRHPKHVQRPTPSHIPRHAPRSQRRSIAGMGSGYRCLIISRSTWLITSLSPGGGEKSRSTAYPPGTSLRYWRVFLSLSRKRLRGPDNPSKSSSFRRRDWMGFGFIACCRARGLRAMSSMRPQLRPRGAGGGPRPTGSTAKPWCALCWRTNAANRGSAPWSGRRRQRKKTAADFAMSARR